MPKLIIATPNAELAEYIQQVVQITRPDCETVLTQSYEDLHNRCAQDNSITAVLCDAFWNNENYYTSLLLLSSYYPHIAWGVASPYDLSEIVSQYSPFPVISAPDNPAPIVSVLSFLLEDLRGQLFGEYFIESYAGQSYLGRSYTAKHTKIDRVVTLTLPYPGASEELLAFFRNSASAMGQVVHPSIYSIYETGENNGRPFIAREPIVNQSLLQLQGQNTTLDSRTIAKVLHTVGNCLNYLQSVNVAYHPIDTSQITISKSSESVVKMQNCAIASTEGMISTEAQLFHLANALMAFVPSPASLYPPLLQLLQNMQAQAISLQDFTKDASKIELALAPVKAVPVRKETIVAKKEVTKARKMFWLYLVGSTIFGIVGVVFIVVLIIRNYVPLPGRDFREQVKIPAGAIKITQEETQQVNEFYMDEYEVTIGQYEKFLKEIENKSMEEILPESIIPQDIYSDTKAAISTLRRAKADMINHDEKPYQAFEPGDWKNIIRAARVRSFYVISKISRDTPVFNVDFIDALAYAHWAGKRLPTELEWQRAASGDQFFTYPWGNEKDFKKANTGKDFEAAPGVLPGSVDGFQGPSEVDQTPQDKSPFGVYNMAGNVCEWTIIPPVLVSTHQGLDPQIQAIRGGSFSAVRLASVYDRMAVKCALRNRGVGIRLVSDKPVEGKKINNN